MKPTNPLFKEVVYKCDCGCPEFLEFTIDTFNDKKEDKFCQMIVSFISEPKTLYQRLKSFLKKRYYLKEIIMNKKDVKELRDFLNSIKLY